MWSLFLERVTPAHDQPCMIWQSMPSSQGANSDSRRPFFLSSSSSHGIPLAAKGNLASSALVSVFVGTRQNHKWLESLNSLFGQALIPLAPGSARCTLLPELWAHYAAVT